MIKVTMNPNNKVNDKKKQRQIDQLNGNLTTKQRRTRVPDKPDYNLSLWSMLKSFIGKDLSKIPLPVNFNEPLSMLQRSAETFEYSELLDKAANCDNIAEQMAFVAAFSVASYAISSYRVLKPFNPLLGETYECDRMSDMGWRLISEQVSHHPPIFAQICESNNGWKCSQDLQMSSKFRGKHISVVPMSFSRVEFENQGRSFRFTRPTTYVHNIIMGKLYIENSGDVFVYGEGKADGWKCVINYQSSSFFSKDQRKIRSEVIDPNGKVIAKIMGNWNEKLEMSINGMNPTEIWSHRLPADDSHLYYNFTVFASQLNEEEDGVAPTDSRKRSDQRLMENGQWDDANKEKVRLEEKQRERRRNNEDVKPIWFAPHKDEISGEVYYKYVGNYWECKNSGNWKKCPDIF